MVDNGKDRTAFLAGAGAAFLMIAQQVASKATRDAFFLSQYAVTALPVMLVVSSIFSIFVVFWFSGLLRRFQPSRLVPLAFLVSALLLSAEWWLTFIHPRAAAAVLYLHIGAFGSILISGFWSLVNERFDPRSGKRIVSRIATGGTLGGLAGGLLAERVAGAYPVTATMPLLSLLHIGTLILLLRFLRRPVVVPSAPDQEQPSDALSSLKILKYHRYLRSLAAFVLLCTACAAVLDYVLKAQAKSSLGTGEELLQFFGLYYSGVSLVTVLVQTLATRRALERFGVVKTLGVLPVVVGGGAV
ncbi:MAG TPA: Npt1/Npt2 family nucleotide transporter, partial [Acidobacteriota bacterium]|nr:Npt1/Npt2 family nucleotide transporter [Acidobacteriota bacterium]